MAMGRLANFLRLVSPKLPQKHWTPQEKRRVHLAMFYAASSWFTVACVAYIHFTTEKKESLPQEDPEILKDAVVVNDRL